jgi:hypothetical protein
MHAAEFGPVPPLSFAPSRLSEVVSEVLFAWWGHDMAPDLVFTARLIRPPSCRVPCRAPRFLTCPRGPRRLAPAGGAVPGAGQGLAPQARP